MPADAGCWLAGRSVDGDMVTSGVLVGVLIPLLSPHPAIVSRMVSPTAQRMVRVTAMIGLRMRRFLTVVEDESQDVAEAYKPSAHRPTSDSGWLAWSQALASMRPWP